ncbi:hypothetical protein RB213_013971 [Colletotrichum asianum]
MAGNRECNKTSAAIVQAVAKYPGVILAKLTYAAATIAGKGSKGPATCLEGANQLAGQDTSVPFLWLCDLLLLLR